MMDEPLAFEQRETKINFIFRIIELVVCSLCLIIFIALVWFQILPIYVVISILIVAALTTILVIASMIIMKLLRKRQKTFPMQWLFIALGSMLCYILCVALFIIQIFSITGWLLFLSLGMAIIAAIVFLLDFIFNLRNILTQRKKNTRLNQVMPVNSVSVEKSEEKLAPNNNEMCSTIECSVIIGDQIACNQQLCHVKWSSDKASTPTAKLIYVQPCSSSVVNEVCPACKKINCEQCARKEENAEITKAERGPKSAAKSTQFPEDDENICPVCTIRAAKVFKTAGVQTSEVHVIPEPVLKPIQENIMIRHVRSAENIESPSRAKNKLVQSFPATPRRNTERLMTCSKCRKRSIFRTKIKKSHFCPVCNQRCTNKQTCTACYNDVVDTDEEMKRTSAVETDVIPTSEESRGSSSKSSPLKKDVKICAKLRKQSESKTKNPKVLIVNEMTQVSPEDFKEKSVKVILIEDKVTQVSLSDFIEETTANQNICCVCNNSKTQQIEKRETETQASFNEFLEGTPKYYLPKNRRIKSEEYKATNVSSKELLEEMKLIMLGEKSTEKIYENKSFGDYNSIPGLMDNESTQVSSRDFLLEEASSPKENKLTQVSLDDYLQEEMTNLDKNKLTQVASSDFVQKVRKPCGAPDCKHPMCAKFEEPEVVDDPIQVILEKQTFDEVVQTEPLKNECPRNKAGKGCTSCTVTEYVDEETITDQFKQISCQTTESLENTQARPSSPLARNKSIEQDERKEMSLEKEVTPREQELPKDLPECIDPNCTCVINDKEILVCTYCESLLNNTLEKSSIIEVQPKNQRNSIGSPNKSGCKCNLPKCICCKVYDFEPNVENQKCFCIKTEKGLLRCTLCETTYQEQKARQAGTLGGMDNPICSSSLDTCFLYQGRKPESVQNKSMYSNQIENTEHSTQTRNSSAMQSERSYKKGSEDEEQKNNRCMEASEKNENEVNEDDYASSTCTSETLSNDFENKYLTPAQMKMLYKKEREDMSYYLATNKEMERYSTPTPEPMNNVTVLTLQKKIQIFDIESQESSDAEKLEKVADNDDDYKENMKSVWDELAGKHAAYQDRLRKELESTIRLTDDTKQESPGEPGIQVFENTQTEMENIYNCMIKTLLERQSQKENNLIFLEKLNCACDSDAESSKHHTDCSSRTEEDACKEKMVFKGSPFFQFQYPKFDIDTREHITANNNEVNAVVYDDDEDNLLLDMKETNAAKVSSDIILISDNVSLSTITEEISGTPSDLISISKESEPTQSKEELLEKPEKLVDLNATYCLKMVKPIDGQQESMQKCNQSCRRDTVFVPLIPCKFQRDVENTHKNTIIQSIKCRNVSPKPYSARSEKCPKKSARLFEPFTLSQTYGSTKTSFTASDNESVVDNGKTLQSTTGSSASFNQELIQEDCLIEITNSQSQSVPITSRVSVPLNEDTHKVFYCGHSIPCTPKKIRWQDSNTPKLKSGKSTFRKECEYDEGNETSSMIVIKNFHPETYEPESAGNRDNAKIVPPLLISNITPELSESEDSRPISCSSHLSARTLQTIDHYNLECSASLKKKPRCVHLEELKRSKKSSSGIKSQILSTRVYPIAEKSNAKLSREPTMRERRISAPLKLSQRKKSSSPKMTKAKSSTGRTFRQKASPYKCSEKKKSRMKSEPVSPEREQVCHCEFYKKSRNNYCRMHGLQSVPVTYRTSNTSNVGCSRTPRIKSTIVSTPRSPQSPKSTKRRSVTPILNASSTELTRVLLSERPKTCDETTRKLTKSDEATLKIDDT